jgi:hypothetical protein
MSMRLSIGVFDENGERSEERIFHLMGADRDDAFAFAQNVIEDLRRRDPSAMFAIALSLSPGEELLTDQTLTLRSSGLGSEGWRLAPPTQESGPGAGPAAC